MPSTYTVAVGSFEGPFDLLLQLIARRKVDIYDISIAEITDDYLAVLRDLPSIDLDTTTEFLVVAATLVELKAARLLPVEDDDLDPLSLEARDLLYARLLEYRTYKHASAWLVHRLAALHGYVARTAGPDPAFDGVRPPLDISTTAEQLARLAERAYAEQPGGNVDVSHLQPVRMSVREAASLVMDELDRLAGRARFRDITAGCRHRVEVISCFLALLELYKAEHIDLVQNVPFGDVIVEAVGAPRWGSGKADFDLAAPTTDPMTVAGDKEPVAERAGTDADMAGMPEVPQRV